MTMPTITISKVFILIAFVCFLLGAIGAPIFGVGGLQIVALGLMFMCVGALVA